MLVQRAITITTILMAIAAPHAAATTYRVPSQKATIQSALATTGVTRVQVDGSFTNYGPILLVNGVRVERDPSTSGTPIIDASGSSTAVTFPTVTSAGTAIFGFSIYNFSTTGISLPNTGSVVAVVDSCLVAGGQYGCVAYQAVHIQRCEMRNAAAAGILTYGTNHNNSIVENNLVAFTATGSTYGIRHDDTAGPGPLVRYNTIGKAGYGIHISSLTGAATTLANNCVVYCTTEGITCVAGTVTVTHNIAWLNGTNYVGVGGDPPAGNSSYDPLICDQVDFKVGINSWCTVANSPWGERVGPVGNIGCTLQTALLTNTTLSDREYVVVNQDFRIREGTTLTLNPGVTFAFDDHDESGGNVDPDLNELIVHGTLDVNGTATDRVNFISLTPVDHDWYGIDNGISPPTSHERLMKIDYAHFSHSEYPFFPTGARTGSYVRNSTFEHSEIAIGLYPLHLVPGAPPDTQIAESNTITMGSTDMIGIACYEDEYGLVKNNTIIGHANASAGIHASPLQLAVHAFDWTGNIISGLTNGKGIWINKGDSHPVLTKNRVSDCKYGVYVEASCTPTIGSVADTTSDNIVTGCSVSGMYFKGVSAGGAVRQSRCTANGRGVITKAGAQPDLGTPSDYGYNIFSNNSTYCLDNQSSSGAVAADGNYLGVSVPSLCTNGSFVITTLLTTVPSEVSGDVRAVGRREMNVEMRITGNPDVSRAVVEVVVKSQPARLRLSVHALDGSLVWSGQEAQVLPGMHSFEWNGLNSTGHRAPSGLYFVCLSSNDAIVDVAKVVLVR